MPYWIIALIRNDYSNDKKYSGPIVLGDYVEKGSVLRHKTSKSSKNWKHRVGGSKLKLMGQLPQKVYRKLHPCMYRCFRFMCVAEYLRCRADGAKYGMRWAALAPIYDKFVPIFVLQVNEMASARRSCRNKPDVFCNIYGEYTIAPNRKLVTSFITRACHAYFGIKLAHQGKVWAPHMVCKVDQWQE